MTCLALCVSAQSAVPPAFEVASFKFVTNAGVPSGASFAPQRSGGRFTWTATLAQLVPFAFNLPAWRVKGAAFPPGFYSVEALAPESTKPEDFRLMLQRLLADRLGLVTHRETVIADAYDLVVDKDGIKAAATSVPLPPYLKGKSPEAFEGGLFTSMEGNGITAITGRGVTFSKLAELLSGELRGVVRDRTGLAGQYYFGFTYRVDRPDVDVDQPTLATALRESLGLRLNREKAPVEVVVVDSINKTPTAN